MSAASAGDTESLIRLSEELDSHDAAARMLAIRGLERRTGTTLGYRYDDPESVRDQKSREWAAYIREKFVEDSGSR